MIAARLHGPRDLRLEECLPPPPPGPGEVKLRVTAAGICGSDLHTYTHARIGDTSVRSPLVLGHEFAGIVVECGRDATDGNGQWLVGGTRVAVDPATPCLECEMCRSDRPHLCTKLRFCGLFPDDGCFREEMIVPSRCCFPLPEEIDDAAGAMLEPLGVAMHAMELGALHQGDRVSLFGAGPIGLLVLQQAMLLGAGEVYVVEPLPWRRDLAVQFGGIPVTDADPAGAIREHTGGRGVDLAIECAWADTTVQQAAESAAPGARVILVGIPSDDHLAMQHSTGRRKELSLLFSRRMKHTYPAALQLLQKKRVDVQSIISHRIPLTLLAEAIAMNAAYRDSVVKVIITI